MTYVLVIHTVEDYDKWKQGYDKHEDMRKKEGSQGAFAFRNAENPKQMVVMTKWKDIKSAKNFNESENLKETMKKAGVLGKPEIYYLDEIERTPY